MIEIKICIKNIGVKNDTATMFFLIKPFLVNIVSYRSKTVQASEFVQCISSFKMSYLIIYIHEYTL